MSLCCLSNTASLPRGRYPTFYKAAALRHGLWSEPEYDCAGPVKKWIVKYSAPFFGWDSLRKKLEFK